MIPCPDPNLALGADDRRAASVKTKVFTKNNCATMTIKKHLYPSNEGHFAHLA